MDYKEVLRLLSINDEQFAARCVSGPGKGLVELEPRVLALVRLGALVAVGGAAPSYGAEVDAAIGAGATTTDIVEVLLGVISVVGLPSVVTAAPSLALALGYDVENALEQPSDM